MAIDENKYNNLVELGGSEYEIKDGEPNIKGWDVKNEEGRKIGEIDELLFDPTSFKVRYLVVDLDDNELELDDDKKILIPIGVADLYGSDMDNHGNVADTSDREDISNTTNVNNGYKKSVLKAGKDAEYKSQNYKVNDDGDVVIVPATIEQLRELPEYIKGKVTPVTESVIRSIFEGTAVAGVEAYNKEKFYDHAHFNEDKFYNRGAKTVLPVIEENLKVDKQEVETGGARITSRIVRRPVEENINLQEEHVTIERNPVNRPVSAAEVNDAFKEEEIELTEHAEVPVVSKEARVVEEVSLNKEVEQREQTIRDTIRNTEVEEERINSGNK